MERRYLNNDELFEILDIINERAELNVVRVEINGENGFIHGFYEVATVDYSYDDKTNILLIQTYINSNGFIDFNFNGTLGDSFIEEWEGMNRLNMRLGTSFISFVF